jgi:arylsulfatase A-like enzyme
MKDKITRRDFLKLSGLLPLGIATPGLLNSLTPIVEQPQRKQNVIIVVFDAFSAHNISLYGYQRETTPNLAKLAERAIVYHNHYAGGNYTTPGTASLLTGTLPWTHRAFRSESPVDESFVYKNIFTAFQGYYRVAYSHNLWVYTFINQFRKSLDKYIPLEEFLLNPDVVIPKLFRYDTDIATVAWNRIINSSSDGFAYSLFFPEFYKNLEMKRREKYAYLKEQFPRGVPKNHSFPFLLEQAIDSMGTMLSNMQQPFMGYFHFFPPHEPYNTHRDFAFRFKNDGYVSVPKPLDIFYETRDSLDVDSEAYDEFILYVDREFGRLYAHLADSGLLDNTWIVLTSDHGELFERGVVGHRTPLLYEPVIHIPLMIFEPGRLNRLDVHTLTSAIDVLPTLLHVTGQSSADWSEGVVMPPFSDSNQNQNRNIYVLEAKKNEKYAPLTIATTALIKEHYKLIYFLGYDELGGKGSERIELFDLKNDPDELNNLLTAKRGIAQEMLGELKSKLTEVNSPYLE